MNISAQGWNDLIGSQPLDPKSIIVYTQLGAALGFYKRSTTFLQAAWGTNPLAFTGNNTTLLSLDSTDASTQTFANQWVFRTKMVNVGASVNGAVSKIAYAKAGLLWDNQFEINLGASTYTDAQTSFRDNLATLGTFAGSGTGAIPVFAFGGSHTGLEILHLTFSTPGSYSMVLVVSTAGTYSTFEIEFIVV